MLLIDEQLRLALRSAVQLQRLLDRAIDALDADAAGATPIEAPELAQLTAVHRDTLARLVHLVRVVEVGFVLLPSRDTPTLLAIVGAPESVDLAPVVQQPQVPLVSDKKVSKEDQRYARIRAAAGTSSAGNASGASGSNNSSAHKAKQGGGKNAAAHGGGGGGK